MNAIGKGYKPTLDNCQGARVKSRALLMNNDLNPGSKSAAVQDGDTNLALRMSRVMAVTVVLAVAISLPLMPWRVTSGLFLGGVLSLLNLHWMRTSIAGAFNQAIEGSRPQIGLVRYILRYFIIGASVYAGYKLKLVSLPATVAGLSSFVVALFVEAFRESYFIIMDREGIS